MPVSCNIRSLNENDSISQDEYILKLLDFSIHFRLYTCKFRLDIFDLCIITMTSYILARKDLVMLYIYDCILCLDLVYLQIHFINLQLDLIYLQLNPIYLQLDLIYLHLHPIYL